jgi:hypothetical protein
MFIPFFNKHSIKHTGKNSWLAWSSKILAFQRWHYLLYCILESMYDSGRHWNPCLLWAYKMFTCISPFPLYNTTLGPKSDNNIFLIYLLGKLNFLLATYSKNILSKSEHHEMFEVLFQYSLGLNNIFKNMQQADSCHVILFLIVKDTELNSNLVLSNSLNLSLYCY